MVSEEKLDLMLSQPEGQFTEFKRSISGSLKTDFMVVFGRGEGSGETLEVTQEVTTEVHVGISEGAGERVKQRMGGLMVGEEGWDMGSEESQKRTTQGGDIVVIQTKQFNFTKRWGCKNE